jgi:hypothetical protein
LEIPHRAPKYFFVEVRRRVGRQPPATGGELILEA